MSGNMRKWMVAGALAAASLLVPGCEDRGQGVEVPGQPDSRELEPATGGAGEPESEDFLEPDNQPSLNEPAGAAEPRGTGVQQPGTGGAGQGGTMARDAGTGGAGLKDEDVGTQQMGPQETGTQGRGVTGDLGSDTGGGGDVRQ